MSSPARLAKVSLLPNSKLGNTPANLAKSIDMLQDIFVHNCSET